MKKMRVVSFAFAVVCIWIGLPRESSAEGVEKSSVILATGGLKCQIEHASLFQGNIYLGFSDVVTCLRGTSYMNQQDGLLDVQLPNNRLMLWVWGMPMALQYPGKFMSLPENPWYWLDSFLHISRDTLELLLGQGIAIDADPALLPVRQNTARSFRIDPVLQMEANGLKIVIDAGHGGQDFGAQDSTGILEKDIVLSVAMKLHQLLREKGYDVRLTRDGDTYPTLSDRVELANDWNADLMLSLHCNSAQRKAASGVETYVLSRTASDPRALALADFENAYDVKTVGDEDMVSQLLGDVARHAQENASNRMATVFHKSLLSNLSVTNRGVRKAPFFVLAGTTMPAFLVELGFLSNSEEAGLLRQPVYQARLARSILDGVTSIQPFLELRSGPAEGVRNGEFSGN